MRNMGPNMKWLTIAVVAGLLTGCISLAHRPKPLTFILAGPALATDKTLVSWVALANTTQQGGSALTIQSGDQFDGIVFGEKVAGKWMAGSEGFARTQGDQQANAVEKADNTALTQMAIVYKGNQISIYRNGEPYAS